MSPILSCRIDVSLLVGGIVASAHQGEQPAASGFWRLFWRGDKIALDMPCRLVSQDLALSSNLQFRTEDIRIDKA
jgi:hypothetical protein